MIELSKELNDYFNNFMPQVKKRAYDGKFNVWFPNITVHNDGSWSLAWEVRSVHDRFEEALSYLKKVA